MPDYIGNIVVPEIAPSGVFPLVPDYPHGRAQAHEVVVHQFGSGNAKIEQRFLLGTGAKQFTVRKAWLRDPDRIALRNFWETKYGPYGAFTYNAPNDDGLGTTAYTCRFANEPLSWEMLTDAACSLGTTLVEIPSSSPAYSLNQTVTRFPSQALKDALLSQVQQIIPIIKIQPLEPGYPAIHLSDRRCTVGGQLYQARLLEFDGISQGMGNEADEVQFSFGNADRVMRDLANDVDLYRAALEFSLLHVGTGIKLDLWKGEIVNWACDAGPEFRVTAADGLYELNLPYPTRKISRTCGKPFNSQACPYSTAGALDLVHFPNADASKCDKGYETENGCLAHGMKRYYGGILAEPQGVRIKDNSTGTWGFGRSPLTSVSLVADSIYDQVLPEIYTDSAMPVNCKIAAGRDESDFYEALGIVGEGPLVAFGTGHKLDGQYHHGYPGSFGLRQVLGSDPTGAQDWFSLDQSGNQTGGDWRKVFAGNSTYKDNFAAGTAFLVIRRSDAKGLQLSRPGEHQMEAVVSLGMKGWVWTSPGVRVWGPPLTNPVWIAINMLLRARGIRLGESATTQQLDLAETFFDVNTAIAGASICDEQVSKLVGSGTETQFKFRGVIQEEKPLRDWLQEVLMNCLGYYTFAFGKLKIGVRVNSSAVEAFTEGNILFRSLQLAPLKPSFNHLTANFADEDFEFVANSVAVYDIDHANLIGGGAGPLFLKSSVNLSGSSSKSQVGRIVAARLREELGGITADEWKKARQVAFKTTVLALNTEPGMVCSMTHPDMPGGSGEFRVVSWRLNRDYSIDIQGRTTTDSMYDLVSGPKPADVVPDQVPEEILIDTGVPGVLSGTPRLGDYGTFAIDDMSVAPDASGNSNIVGAHEITLALYYVDELTTDLWASIDTDMDAATDPATVSCTVNPDTSRVFRVGDFVVLNNESADPNNPGRRSYECAQIIGPGDTGDVVPTGDFTFQRAYPGVPEGQATFGTMRCAHLAGIRLYKIDQKTFTFSVRKGFFRTPGLPARIEAKLPSACLVAALAGVANHFGYGPFTVFPLSRHNEPYMPGLRTCNGGAYTFQVPGPLSVQDNVVIPLKVQDAASIRCIYAYLQQGTTDGQSAFLVKISRDDGATWEPLEYMGIAQALPDACKNTYDFLVNNEGYGLPASRRLPYADYGLALAQAVTANPAPQTLQTASYGANRLGLAAGQFLFLDPGGANEEYVKVITADPDNQTFDAILTKDHADGERIRPAIWPTPILLEGDDLAFDILAVASPDPGEDLTVVLQT
ncbi:MAG: hypothetical protein ABFD89_05545 [Bryobacteraceae bacterium]